MATYTDEDYVTYTTHGGYDPKDWQKLADQVQTTGTLPDNDYEYLELSQLAEILAEREINCPLVQSALDELDDYGHENGWLVPGPGGEKYETDESGCYRYTYVGYLTKVQIKNGALARVFDLGY